MADPAYMHAAALAATSHSTTGNPNQQFLPSPVGQQNAGQHFVQSPRPRTLLDQSRRSRSPTSRTLSLKAADPRTSKLTARSVVRTSSLSPSRTRTPTTSSPARRLPPTPDNHIAPVSRTASTSSNGGTCNKRLEATLTKFSQSALPFHLEVIQQRQANIERLQTFGDWEGVVSEVDEATRAVHQLGTLLFEMEILRTYLEQVDLQLFDSILEPAKTTAFTAVQGLVDMCPSNTKRKNITNTNDDLINGHRRSVSDGSAPVRGQFDRRHSDSETHNFNGPELQESSQESTAGQSTQSTLRRRVATSCAAGLEGNNSALEKRPSFGRLQSCGGTLEVLYEDPKEDVASILSGGLDDDDRRRLLMNEEVLNLRSVEAEVLRLEAEQKTITRESWLKLEEELRDLHELITTFSITPAVTARTEASKKPLDQESQESSSQLSSSAIYPVAGALLGTCLGGPVGLLAGVKIGGLAAIGGSVFGYSTGSIIKQQLDRQEYIDDFYAQHTNTNCSRSSSSRNNGSVKSTTTFLDFRRKSLQKQRAHSLPDVLDSLDTQDCDQAIETNEKDRLVPDTPPPHQQLTLAKPWSAQAGPRPVQSTPADFASNPVTRSTFTTLQSPRTSIGAAPSLQSILKDPRPNPGQGKSPNLVRSHSIGTPEQLHHRNSTRIPNVLHSPRLNGSAIQPITSPQRHVSLVSSKSNGSPSVYYYYTNNRQGSINNNGQHQSAALAAATKRKLQARSADNLLL